MNAKRRLTSMRRRTQVEWVDTQQCVHAAFLLSTLASPEPNENHENTPGGAAQYLVWRDSTTLSLGGLKIPRPEGHSEYSTPGGVDNTTESSPPPLGLPTSPPHLSSFLPLPTTPSYAPSMIPINGRVIALRETMPRAGSGHTSQIELSGRTGMFQIRSFTRCFSLTFE